MNTRRWIYFSREGRQQTATWRKAMAQRWLQEDTCTLRHCLWAFESARWNAALYEPEMQARTIRKILTQR